MNCMKDYIGPFRGCGAPIPQSGMWLTQIPGIEFANIDGIANADEVGWSGVWDDIQQNASETFRNDIISQFGNRYLLKQITQTVDLGVQINTSNLTAPIGGQSNGIIIEQLDPGSQCACSNLMEIYIQSINYYWYGVSGSPTFTLTFQDADTGTILYTITPTTVLAGWNYVYIDKSFSNNRVLILATGNFTEQVQLDISQFNLDNFGGYTWGVDQGGWLNFNYGGCGCQCRLNGVQYTTAGNIANPITNTFGMSCIFSTKCTWDNFVCKNKRHFAHTWLYCLAIEYLNFRINSSRLNRWTTTDLEQAVELRNLMTLKYRGGDDSGSETKKTKLSYPGILKTACDSITINDYDCCVKSNSYIIWKEVIC